MRSAGDARRPTAPAELVRRVQRGNDDALHELIVAYQRRTAGFVFALTNRSDSVEDLTQQVFIKMIGSLPALREPGQFDSWFFRLVRNTCLDHLRYERLRRIFRPLLPADETVPESPLSVGTEECDALRHALSKLRPCDRGLLALVHEGRSHAEIAAVLSIGIPAMKARLCRAREALRQHYESPADLQSPRNKTAARAPARRPFPISEAKDRESRG